MHPPYSPFKLTQQEYAEAIFSKLGKGREHAALLYREWFSHGTADGLTPSFHNAESLRQNILALTDLSLPPVSSSLVEGSTCKFLLDVGGGLTCESVLLPMRSGWTLCLSSQVGCRMGCSFCETGRMGLLRNLRADEIVAQVWTACHIMGKRPRNLVFMGMGEPFDNYDEVMRAVLLLTSSGGLKLYPRNITLSTSGRVDAIYRFIEEGDPSLHLAVSVNAPTDAIRTKLMAVNRKFDLEALYRAMQAYCAHPRRLIFAEYVLIREINDTPECAAALANYLRGLRVKINLIPYNPGRHLRYLPPTSATVEAFAAILRAEGYRVLVRGTKGQAIMAACGQLGGRKEKVAFKSTS